MHPVAKTNYSDVIKITIFLSWGIIFSVFSLIQTATATAANRKSHLKSKTALLQTLSRLYYSISFSSSNVGISFWRILKDCIEVQEKKKKSLSCLYVLHRSEIRYFHVVVVQWWRRNVQKSVHEQSCCFAKLSLLFFLPFSLTLPSSLLPNVGQMFLGANMNYLITGHVSQRLNYHSIQGNPYSGVREIRGSGKFCSWNPKSWTLESGIPFKE